jgi:hypothetical protein
MSNHKYYTDWSDFWEFYMQSVKEDIGTSKFAALKNSSSRLTKKLERIEDNFRINTLDPLIRKAGMIPEKVLLKYDPKATTFYSAYSRERKRFYIGYPTFTKYMCYWEPAMKAAFRHEMGHILRGDCLLTMKFSKVRNTNCCMDIRINDQLGRNGLLEVYKCMGFKDKDKELLVPEEQFLKIDLPYDEENPFIPEWWVIANKFNQANERQRKDNEGAKDNNKQEQGFVVGDYVIIDARGHKFNGEPGKIIDIDEEGNYVIESISEEEYAMILESVESNRMQLTQSGDLLGIFTKAQIISAIPEEEGEEGSYGDDGDEDSGGDSGGDDEDDDGEEGEEGDGEGEDGKSSDEKKTPEDIIKEKEEILEDLLNGGVDGANQGDDVWSDELSDEEDEEKEDSESDKGEPTDKEDLDSEKKDGDGESKENENEEEVIDWTDEQRKRKKDVEDKIQDINLTKNINKSINNFKSIKEKHKDELTKEEMMQIDKALTELETLI